MSAIFQLPNRVYVGSGSLKHLQNEFQERSTKTALVITDNGIVEAGLLTRLSNALTESNIRYEVWSEVEPEPGIASIDHASEVIRKVNPDLIIAFGGGSAIDTAKIANSALAHDKSAGQMLQPGAVRVKGRPVIAVPTTSGTGSEVTPIAIATVPGQILKIGLVHPTLIPDIAVVDARLTLTVPPKLTAATGIDALCHAVEAALARRSSPMTEPYCYDAIKRIGRSLRKAVWNGSDLAAREDMAYGSLFAGIGLSNAGVGAVHAISYPIGGKYHISHGECITLLLVEVLKWMVPAAIEPLAKVAEALGINMEGLTERMAAEAAIAEIDRLINDVNLPRTFSEFGVDIKDLQPMAETASGIDRLIRNSPRILKAPEIEQIYHAVY